MHSLRSKQFLLSAVLITATGLMPWSANAQLMYEIKPRILIVFDTSGSMAWNFSGNNTRGDGTNELWNNGRYCCPGTANGGGTTSRLYAAKNAMTQMLNASGEIEFGLLKFNQNYSSNQPTTGFSSNQYYANQIANTYDRLRYEGTSTFTDWRDYLAVGFGDYSIPDTTNLIEWRDVNTENNRSEIAMWMDHHEYGNGTAQPDTSLFPGPWNDFKEQELRADGGTPLEDALVAARSYLTLLRDVSTGLDDFRSCRKYTVIVLTDGAADSGQDPVDAVTNIYGDGIDTWVIGLAYSSTTLNNMAAAGGNHFDPNNWGSAFTANSQEALSAALFYIVSESLAFEDCNYKDDDCDGEIDEGVIGQYCDVHNVLNTRDDTDSGWIDVVVTYDTDSSTDTDTDLKYNPNYPLTCTDPGETLCDGIDDNCNGEIDEAPADGTWSSNEDPDFGQLCVDTDAPLYLQNQLADSDAVLPPCVAGTWTCIPGGDGKTCVNYIGHNPERCDGIDNDCDGLVDEANAVDTDNYGLEGDTCGNSQGICTPGIYTCVDTGWVCSGGTVGTDETCNGSDDNCNGDVDETYPEAGELCYDGTDSGCNADGTACKGICNAGIRTCTGGVLGCSGEQNAAVSDVCNGLDDDCDGDTDEDAATGVVCPTGAAGWTIGGDAICNRGTTQCMGASGLICVGDSDADIVRPAVEVCDGLDNDCDGSVDEGLYGPCGGCESGVDTDWDCISTDPGAGECRVGVGACDPVNSSPGNPVYMNCNDQGPVAETCNGKDDDCDGHIDESADLGDATIGDICYPTGLSGCEDPDPDTGGTCAGECDYGQIACVNGIIACAGYTDPVGEGTVCDNLDNNCNGLIDEGITNACGTAIDTSQFPGASYDKGECAYGIQYCSSDTDSEDPATWGACQGARGPLAELCNGLDDDCDGLYEDEDTADLLANATTSFVGEDCGSCDGVYECVRDTDITEGEIGAWGLQCVGGEAQAEVCNGQDENCNDVIDDGIAPVACGGCEFGVDTEWDCINGQPDAGQCEVGYDYCIDGEFTTECYGAIGPMAEVCDGLDNDCDGEIDEDFDAEVICQEAVGECPQGILKCAELDGELGLNCCDAETWATLGTCEAPPLSQLEICDGLDNDCDGQIDEEIGQAGQPCGSYLGVCEPGVYQCVETGDTEAPAINGFEVVCVGGSSGSAEVCNNLDDDCDGAVDEDIPVGDVCTKAPNWMSDPQLQGAYPDGIGECPVGNYECVAGDWVCNVPGPTDEVCDGLDNDCDGLVDEDEQVECPAAGSICIEGTCAEPCGFGEFECPAGKSCTDVGNGEKVCMTTLCDSNRPDALPCVFNENYCTPGLGFEPPCTCDTLSAMCVDVCYSKVCPEGSECIAADGGRCHSQTEGCMVSGCDVGQICMPIDVCDQEPCQQCVTDPCANVTCEDGQYCNSSGVCVATCENVQCPVGQGCKDGACAADDPCAGIVCASGVVCNPASGMCDSTLTNPCKGVVCEFFESCEDGVCVFDECMNVNCPNGTVCHDGSCYATGGFVPGNGNGDTDNDSDGTDTGISESDSDGDTSSNGTDTSSSGGSFDTEVQKVTYEGLDRVLATGTGGCMCAVAPGAQTPDRSGWMLLIAGLGLLMLRLSRAARRIGKRLPIIGMTLGAAVLLLVLTGCAVEPYEFEGANDKNDSTVGSGGGDSSGGTDSDSSSGSGGTDDSASSGVDTDDTDSAGGGTDAGCAACDTDETCCTNAAGVAFCADLNSSPSNCGGCNQVCSKTHASATCVAGVCTLQACETYWHDINLSDSDGCEYYCKPTADQDDDADICDGAASSADPANDDYVPLDNDCDFEYDEDVLFLTDPNNCGYCGNICLFNHATAQCVDGVCTMGACDAKWYDRENGSADGCEYYCDGSPDDVEVCDFQDNNCDGQVDESDPNEGAACYPEGSSGCTAPYGDTDCRGICKPGVMSCSEGTLRCTGYQLATLETCDGVDNNCNGLTDENLAITCGGGDGANPSEGLCQTGLAACASASFGTSDAVYDTDNCVGSVEPREERCDGKDNDCDGLVDEFADSDGNGNNIDINDARLGIACGLGACASYLTKCEGGSVTCDNYTVPASDTPCNGVDDDCDGIVDEIDSYLCGGSNGLPCNDTAGCDDYSEGVCQAGTFTCSGGTMVCSGDVGPNVSDSDHQDICDNLDNDCDGLVDEDAFYNDTDTDRSCGSPCNDGTLACINGTMVCSGETQPTPDLCDTAGADEDCNDATVNGAGEPNFMQSCDGTDAGDCEEGYWECGPSGMFCNEADGDDLEVCDGVDNDCDGLIDGEDTDMVLLTTGDLGCDDCPGTEQAVCAGTSGWQCKYDQASGVDCGADTDCYSHASIETLCDNIDNDCDGVADDDFQLQSNVNHCGQCNNVCADLLSNPSAPNVAEYYCAAGTCRIKSCAGTDEYYNINGVDSDGCECQVNAVACDSDANCDKCSNGSLLDVDDDCDGVADENASAETCNGIDDDCDSAVDEGLTNPGYCEPLCDPLLSGDATCANGTWVCDYTCGTNGLECDTDSAPDPSTPEAVCDGIDGNCNGSVDEGFGLGQGCNNAATGAIGGCLRYGKVYCSASGDTECCDPSETDVVCQPENIINLTDSDYHADTAEDTDPNGIDDDCDGIVDEGANGAIDFVTVTYENAAATTLYFDIFRYEASRGDATIADAGSVSTAACSKAGVMPWTYVNFAEARAACQLLNTDTCADSAPGCWDLCSIQQWEYACAEASESTWFYPYDNDYAWDACNGRDYGVSQDNIAARSTAAMTECIAPWAAQGSGSADLMDMSGNVEEWTATASVLGTGTTLYGIRGGSFNDLSAGLTCDFDFSGADGSATSYRLENLGFRCCRMYLGCNVANGDADCPDNFWCNGGTCEEANTNAHCGDGSTA
ncbi:MAG: SUMF1/EgtB/PvdO family nonheme iron enzyme, partial [Deltaproteobacteria bacterium]|nr:SUMF1/EgtB/PvdO family nonheme iron enzyme [Deltaproteobacteria bacterium]